MFTSRLCLATVRQHFSRINRINHNSSVLTNRVSMSAETSSGGKRELHKSSLRHVRHREQQGGVHALEAPTLITLTVIGNGSRGTPASFLLEHRHFKYMFNCGEGVQKICQEHKMKLAKAEHVFITHKHWRNLGGLLGMALSVQEANLPKLTLYGPPLVEEIITSSRTFATLNRLVVDKVEREPYDDPAFEICAVPLVTGGKTSPSSPLRDVEGQPVTKRRRSSSPGRTDALNDDHDVAFAYVCKPHPTKGKLDLHKCVELGVPRGKLFGELKDGKEITLENGNVVRPEDVLILDKTPTPLIVVDCPTADHLDPLLNAEEINKWQNKDDEEQNAQIVVHFTPDSIMSNERYQKWLERFGSNTDHLVLNGSGSEIANLGVYELQCKLNLVHDRIFPLLHHQKQSCKQKTGQETMTEAEGNKDTECEASDSKFVIGETKLTYHMRPRQGFKRESCVKLETEKNINEALDLPLVEEVIRESQTAISQIEKENINERAFPEIIFLGTGSSVPNKVRSVSAILLRLSEERSVLLDCGEGTYGQMYRLYGDSTDDIIRSIQCIFISHMHADHHLGVAGIVNERKRALASTGQTVTSLPLLAPLRYEYWMNAYHHKISPIIEDIRLIPLQKFLPWLDLKKLRENKEYATLYDKFLLTMQEIGLSSITPVEVNHCNQAFGVVLTLADGWKCVYSGDTLPCEALIDAGKFCDVLIHEATMEDDLQDKALAKKHSTTSQAIDVGLKMQAKFILLTHFSQRYAKIPLFSDKFTDKVGIAFDNMRLRSCDLKILPKLNEALKTVFQEEYADLLEKFDKRTWKRQLLQAEDKSTDEIVSSKNEPDEKGFVKEAEQTVSLNNKTKEVQCANP